MLCGKQGMVESNRPNHPAHSKNHTQNKQHDSAAQTSVLFSPDRDRPVIVEGIIVTIM